MQLDWLCWVGRHRRQSFLQNASIGTSCFQSQSVHIMLKLTIHVCVKTTPRHNEQTGSQIRLHCMIAFSLNLEYSQEMMSLCLSPGHVKKTYPPPWVVFMPTYPKSAALPSSCQNWSGTDWPHHSQPGLPWCSSSALSVFRRIPNTAWRARKWSWLVLAWQRWPKKDKRRRRILADRSGCTVCDWITSFWKQNY